MKNDEVQCATQLSNVRNSLSLGGLVRFYNWACDSDTHQQEQSSS